MMILRTNAKPRTLAGPEGTPSQTGDSCFAAMERHNSKPPVPPAAPVAAATSGQPPRGDVLYGGLAVARWMFPDEEPGRARRRVFHLWAYHNARKERAGFFKLKGALCLSKSQWLAFHGLS